MFNLMRKGLGSLLVYSSANILGSVDMKTHLRPTVEVLQNFLNEVRDSG